MHEKCVACGHQEATQRDAYEREQQVGNKIVHEHRRVVQYVSLCIFSFLTMVKHIVTPKRLLGNDQTT